VGREIDRRARDREPPKARQGITGGGHGRFLVLAAQREGSRALSELLAPIGLTAAQAEVLALLRDEPRPLSVREIGQRLVCEAAARAGSSPPSSIAAWPGARRARATGARWS
jgi:hypothetical protein